MTSSPDIEQPDPMTTAELPPSGLEEMFGRSALTVPIMGMFVLIILYTLYLASSVLIPITLAILLSRLLGLPTELIEGIGVPRALASALVVLAAFGLLLSAIYILSGPSQTWISRLPEGMQKMERHLRPLAAPIEELRKAAQEIERVTDPTGPLQTQRVQVQRPGLAEMLLTGTMQGLASMAIIAVLVYLLLASGDTFLRKLVAVTPTFKDKKRAVEIVRKIQDDISSYLGMVTAINVLLGFCVAATTAVLGIPNPLLWGVLTVILSFAPYIGELAIATILLMVGMLTFDSLPLAVAAPAIYLTLMSVAHIIFPLLLSRRLSLNPVSIFLAIILWGFMWGIVGALLAVPLLASFKIICERVEALNPIAEFLTP